MASLRHPVSIFGLAALALIAGLAQAPAQAQANALQELSRQMIGSSFDSNNSPTTLPGSPSLVEGGSESSGRVVGDLVDQEIRSRPTAPKPVATRSGPQTVQLLVPVRTGLEFAQIERLVPGVKILEMNGGVFVLVSESSQALPAYQKGRDLQARLGMAFQLAYSEGHPDLNLAWMAGANTNLASAPKPASTHKSVAVKPAAAPKPGAAKDLGLLVAQAPWINRSEPVTQSAALSTPEPLVQSQQNKAPVQMPAKLEPVAAAAPKSEPTVPSTDSELATLREPSRVAMPVSSSIPEAAEIPSPVTTSVDVVAPRNLASDLKTVPVVATAPHSSLHDTLAELRAMRQAKASVAVAAPVPNQQTESAVAQPVAASRPAPFVQAVAIRPANLAEVPLVSSRFMAVNQDLAYVYVKVRNGGDVAAVNRVAPVAVVHDRDGQLLARVGVYSNTRLGQRLRDQQLQQLRQRGYEVELVAGGSLRSSSNQA